MSVHSYVPHGNDDPEETVEEEMLLEALRAHHPDILVTDHDGARGTVAFGRLSDAWGRADRFAWPPAEDFVLPYWTDPAFLAKARRDFQVHDMDGAERRVAELHASGRGAFLKSVKSKQLALRIPVGTGFLTAMDAMAYSFIDLPDCLIVQPMATMEYEYRIFVVDGEVVTGAGCIPPFTPQDNEATFDPKMARLISEPEPERREDLLAAYLAFAREVVPTLKGTSYTLDVALVDGAVGIVELNQCIPGGCGLYACDVDVFADANVRRAVRSVLARGVEPEEARPPKERVPFEPTSPLLLSILEMRKDFFG